MTTKSKCHKCKRNKATLNLKYTPPLCSRCFVNIIEHRVRKDTRTNNIFKKGDNILILDDGSKEARVSIFLMESIAADMPIMVKEKKVKKLSENVSAFVKKYKINKIIIPWNADKEAEQFVESVFNKKKLKQEKKIRLLRTVLDKEIEIFAKIKGLRYKKAKKSKTEIAKFLAKADERYPGTKFSLVKSRQAIQKISGKSAKKHKKK